METTSFGLTDLFYIVGGMLLFALALLVLGALYSAAPDLLRILRALRARYLTRAALDSLIERIADLPKLPTVVKDNEEKPVPTPQVMSSAEIASATVGTSSVQVVPRLQKQAEPAEPLIVDELINQLTRHKLSDQQLEKLLTLLRDKNGEFALSQNAIISTVGGRKDTVNTRIKELREATQGKAQLPTVTPIAQRPTTAVFKSPPEPSKV